tara:strand:+ start:610 stop:1245 length:636 start_codon:yes stop_codon:yes gene_type:complete
MSNYLPVGSVIDYRRDTMATSGDHLDVRIIPQYGPDKGKRIDPSTRPNLLNRIVIGDDRKPLSSFTMTSGYGPRDTGIPGASKFHKGLDYAIGSGNKIFLEGGSGYFSQNGVGVATIKDAENNPYEIEFYHTDVGESTMDATPMPGGGGSTGGGNKPAQAKAKEKAKAYQDMSKSEMDSAYDAMRSDPAKAKTEGMKMHEAYFNKPKSVLS